MAKYPNIDELSEEELAEYLNSTEQEDLKADETDANEDTDNPDAVIYKDVEEKIEIAKDGTLSTTPLDTVSE